MLLQKRHSFFILFVLLIQIHSQTQLGLPFVDPGIIQGFLSPESIIMIANYYGCAKWNQSLCESCSVRFYMNSRMVCVEVDPLCRDFNYSAKICTSCYDGYTLLNNSCSLMKIDSGCLKTNKTGC